MVVEENNYKSRGNRHGIIVCLISLLNMTQLLVFSGFLEIA